MKPIVVYILCLGCAVLVPTVGLADDRRDHSKTARELCAVSLATAFQTRSGVGTKLSTYETYRTPFGSLTLQETELKDPTGFAGVERTFRFSTPLAIFEGNSIAGVCVSYGSAVESFLRQMPASATSGDDR